MFRAIARHIFSPIMLMLGVPMIMSLSDPAAGGTIGGAIAQSLQTVASPLSASDIESFTTSAVSGFVSRSGRSHGGSVYISGGGPIFLPYN